MKWDGQEFDLLSTKESTSSTEQESNERFCFWKEVLKSMSGSGIVVSASDQQVTEVMNLLKVLRFLENELPIQIVHKGDLNRDSQKRIIEIGRGVDTPHDKFKQNVWFVDVSNCLHIDHLNKFTRFKNKWLSVLFSSFEEIILMDADTVPLVKPSTLLQNEKYKRSGALFFKDRALSETIWSSEVYLYKSLLPNNLEQRVFGTALQTKRIFENTFFRLNRRHFMESGLVVLNRNHHMTGLLMGCQLNMWDLTSKPVHGDKELFWLGQLLSGQEDFEFANKHAAAIGQVEQSGKIKKVCSTQVAHFDDNGELIWINGGLSTCKKNSACYDYSRFKNLRGNFNSCLSLDSYYQHPIAPKVALITAPKEYSMFQRSLGWKQQPDLGCLGYFWCTHSDSNAENDELIEFNSTFREYFQNLANIWTGVN
ncbi:hypothetical protein G9P44_000448 [Scheffersomyces stipitis]|nr:hypothetical protein G9P44_000448 [Scheffersomyces stipitis]